jgi:hypothetical protein
MRLHLVVVPRLYPEMAENCHWVRTRAFPGAHPFVGFRPTKPLIVQVLYLPKQAGLALRGHTLLYEVKCIYRRSTPPECEPEGVGDKKD